MVRAAASKQVLRARDWLSGIERLSLFACFVYTFCSRADSLGLFVNDDSPCSVSVTFPPERALSLRFVVFRGEARAMYVLRITNPLSREALSFQAIALIA